jgi:hypothetical protein
MYITSGLDGSFSRVPLGKDIFGNLRFGDGEVMFCDRIATNGIIHTVNKVVLPFPFLPV